MPTYVYESVRDDGFPPDRFEIVQRMSDPALTQHPVTGEPIRRVILSPLVGGKYSSTSMKRTVSDDKRIGELGFTKYVRQSDGTYEKRAGQGPTHVDPRD